MTSPLFVAKPVKPSRARFVDFSTLAGNLSHGTIDLLKMDIEGAEYRVIDDICRGSLLPAQLLIEFHHRIDGAQIENTMRSIACLRQIGSSSSMYRHRDENCHSCTAAR